jgi:hypothetical protein
MPNAATGEALVENGDESSTHFRKFFFLRALARSADVLRYVKAPRGRNEVSIFQIRTLYLI